MKAMVLERAGEKLALRDLPLPVPGPGQARVRVQACAVCRTDLHVVDGELARPKLPLVPGHEIVGTVESAGPGCALVKAGDRVGVPWLGWTCGRCEACRRGQENLCAGAKFTGYTLDGGYAEYCVADERYCFKVPEAWPAERAAPLLCAGLIGYRAYRMVPEARRLGLYGFGAAAHLLAQLAAAQGREVYAFTRRGDQRAQAFARRVGCVWAGESGEVPPRALDAALIFAPAGGLVPEALARVRPGGTVVCAGIHMSDIPSFPYSLLWGERCVRSVANLTRADGTAFFEAVAGIRLDVRVETYALERANEALADLREGRLTGAAVLKIGEDN
jgi:propanol-preferring alcohol dehydrogenase